MPTLISDVRLIRAEIDTQINTRTIDIDKDRDLDMVA